VRAERVVAKRGVSMVKNDGANIDFLCSVDRKLAESVSITGGPLESDDRRGSLGAQSSVKRLGDLGGVFDV
jgi:hypothetical protein